MLSKVRGKSAKKLSLDNLSSDSFFCGFLFYIKKRGIMKIKNINGNTCNNIANKYPFSDNPLFESVLPAITINEII